MSVLDLFIPLTGILKFDAVCIDNIVFRLHYKVSVIILMACTIFAGAKQYIGDPIDCVFDNGNDEFLDTYCWIHSTYTVPKQTDRIGVNVPHRGISGLLNKSDQVQIHKYYQWVGFVLFAQALAFYVPRYLWKSWEGGYMAMLVNDLKGHLTDVDEDTKGSRKALLIQYFITHMGHNNFYALAFIFCEFLNFLNVVTQIILTDIFLGHQFTTYGRDVWAMAEKDPYLRNDPMTRVFPTMTKCEFEKYGPSGNIMTMDGLCVLPVNIINEKIYIVLWNWFGLLAVVSGISLIYRLVIVFIPKARVLSIWWQIKGGNSEQHIKYVVAKCSLGDWFVLNLIGKNVNGLIFGELIDDLGRQLQKRAAIRQILQLQRREIQN